MFVALLSHGTQEAAQLLVAMLEKAPALAAELAELLDALGECYKTFRG